MAGCFYCGMVDYHSSKVNVGLYKKNIYMLTQFAVVEMREKTSSKLLK